MNTEITIVLDDAGNIVGVSRDDELLTLQEVWELMGGLKIYGMLLQLAMKESKHE